MPIILIDVNIEGHAAHIWMRLQSSEWREFTTAMDVQFKLFRDVGLDSASPDDLVWRFCQARGYYFLTSNRNEEAADSLEATLQREGTSATLPVITLPQPDRVFYSPAFLDRVVEKLLDHMLYADANRGAGRLFLP